MMNVGKVLWAGVWLCFALTVCIGSKLDSSFESEHEVSTHTAESSAQLITVLATISRSTSSDSHTARSIQTSPTDITDTLHVPTPTKSSELTPTNIPPTSHEPTEPESSDTRSTRDHRASKSSTDLATTPTSLRITAPHKTEHSARNTSVDGNPNSETTQTQIVRSRPGIKAPRPYVPLNGSTHAKTFHASWCTVLLLICQCLGIVCLM